MGAGREQNEGKMIELMSVCTDLSLKTTRVLSFLTAYIYSGESLKYMNMVVPRWFNSFMHKLHNGFNSFMHTPGIKKKNPVENKENT